ncbi:hypothetical protein V6N13_024724 [Hibiscus sabdariffa]
MSGSQGTQSSQSSTPCNLNDPISNKPVRKRQQLRAPCWKHFSKFVTEDGVNRARCIHCDATYSMETGGSTTNLNNHLKTCLKTPQGNTADFKQSELAFAKTMTDLEKGEGFKLFLPIACPRFHLPSRYTVRRDCLDLFNSMKKIMKTSFGKDTGQALENCIRDWGIERVFSVTVDNASANSVGIEYLRKKLNHRNTCVANGKYMHTRCVAHNINLIVQEGVKYASISVDRVRAAVRWNSTYMMLKVVEKYEHAFDSYARDDHSFFLTSQLEMESQHLMIGKMFEELQKF